jgi:hypothetical protein
MRSYAKPILVTPLMNSAALFAWWGLFTWILAMQAGMWLG